MVVEHVYHVSRNTMMYVNYHCLNRNQEPCNIGFEIINQNNYVVYRKEPSPTHVVKVNPIAKGDIYFRFINNEVSRFLAQPC